ncbi:MAG TPA: preprotein translocase subunit SecY, partial [Rhodospirillaceae bacterium]|nr:preprotein translocase subunit SecY [Rhodospirillaceae bacterium]
GIGNGISLIIFAGIVAELPRSLAFLFEQVRIGAMSVAVLFGIVIMVVSVIAFVVFMERAQRRVIVQYPKRQMGNRMYGGDSTHLPLKLNTSGVIPPIFASALLLLPLSAVGLAGGTGPGWLQSMSAMLQHGQPLFMALYAGLIVFFAFFYTAITFNPGEVADNLRKYGGFVPGTRPGQNTADYLERILNRITVIGAAYLVVVCMIPELLISQNASVPFYFGGTSLLIVVTVTMDTVSQIHSHMLAHQYEGLVKKSKLRGRR